VNGLSGTLIDKAGKTLDEVNRYTLISSSIFESTVHDMAITTGA